MPFFDVQKLKGFLVKKLEYLAEVLHLGKIFAVY